MQAKKQDELIKFLEEVDLKSVGGNYWSFLELTEPLLAEEKTREQGLRLFRKIWGTFPEERTQLAGQLGQEETLSLPEVYDYARQALFPHQGWSGELPRGRRRSSTGAATAT